MAKFVLVLSVITCCLHLLLPHAPYYWLDQVPLPVPALPVHHVGLVQVLPPDNALRGNHHHPVLLVLLLVLPPISHCPLQHHQGPVELVQDPLPVQALLGRHPVELDQVPLPVQAQLGHHSPHLGPVEPVLLLHAYLGHFSNSLSMSEPVFDDTIQALTKQLKSEEVEYRKTLEADLFSFINEALSKTGELVLSALTQAQAEYKNALEAKLFSLIKEGLAKTGELVSSALAPLTDHQEDYEKKSDLRFENILREMAQISSSLKSPQLPEGNYGRYDHPNISPSPQCLPSESPPLSPQPPRTTSPPPRASSSLSRAELCAASNTLGFFPIYLSHATPDKPNLALKLSSYLRNILLISSTQIGKLEHKEIWYDRANHVLYAQFFSDQMCHIVFRHMKNLKENQRVQKYIHPLLQDQHRTLIDQAFHLRHSSGYLSRIDYCNRGLVLAFKEPECQSWTFLHDNKAPQSKDITEKTDEPVSTGTRLSFHRNRSSHLPEFFQPSMIFHDDSFDTIPDLENETEHNVDDFHITDKIDQLDGNDTIEDGGQFPSIEDRRARFEINQDEGPCSSFQRVDNSVRQAPFILNKEKQLSGLDKNTTIPDFSIQIIDAINASIFCSTGFYAAVARPSLSSLDGGLDTMIDGVPIKCVETTHGTDQLGRSVNSVLRFKVGSSGQCQSATVHLHHTQQHVQVQGGATLWFVQHVLKNRFAKGSRNKKFNIKELNKIFNASAATVKSNSGSATEAAKTCFHCSKGFRSNPAICGNCCKSFHNTKQNKCFNIHTCPDPSPNTPSFGFPSPGINDSNPPQLANVTSSEYSSVHQSGATPVLPTCSVPVTTIFDTSTRCSTITPPTLPSTSLFNPNAVPFAPQVGIPPSSTSNAAPSTTSRSSIPRRGKTPAIPSSAEAIEIEFLKIQVNVAHTKITELETKLNDKNKLNVVLSDKLKIMEESIQKQTFQQYFPTSNPPPSAPMPSSLASPQFSLADLNTSLTQTLNLIRNEIASSFSNLSRELRTPGLQVPSPPVRPSAPGSEVPISSSNSHIPSENLPPEPSCSAKMPSTPASNDSIDTIDEFTEDIPMEDTIPHLN